MNELIGNLISAGLEHFPFLCSEPRASARAVSRCAMRREGRWTRHTKTGIALALPFTTAAASLMKTMCEPVAKELGKIGGDTISVIRARYLDDVLNRASKKIEDRGITAGNVAPKLLLPILESASLEDDDWMKDRWADLIATAATGDEEVDPAFATMLAELTPIEAKDLVENVQRLHKPRAEDKLMDEGFVHLDNWLRLRIIEPRSQGFYYMLSDLGTRFLKACGAMQPDSSADETNRSEEADA